MKLLLSFIAFFVLVCLAGCVHRLTPVQAQCQRACLIHFEQCKRKCSDNCTTCSINASKSARLNYGCYLNEKIVQGDFIARDLQSYRDPLQCRKVSCNCLADLNTCTQGCTGIIKKQLVVVPKC